VKYIIYIHIRCQLLHVVVWSLSTKFCRSNKYFRCYPPLASVIKVKRLRLLKLWNTHHQVYVHIVAQTTPQSDEPPLLHSHSHFFFLGCAHKHLYQYVIQRDLTWLKGSMYPISGYTVYSLVHCVPWHAHCTLQPNNIPLDHKLIQMFVCAAQKNGLIM